MRLGPIPRKKPPFGGFVCYYRAPLHGGQQSGVVETRTD